MSAVVLVNGPQLERLERRLDETFQVLRLWQQPDQDAFLTEQGSRVEGLVSSAFYGVDRALMERLPNLKIIVNCGVGFDAIDVQAARERGIIVTNTPDVLDDCVADAAMALLLDVARGISAADRFVRAGRWESGKGVGLSRKVGGSVCGILGLGRIGRAIALRAQAFGMEIAYHGRHEQKDCSYRYCATLDELARIADFLVVAVPGGKGTTQLVNDAVLQALGPEGYLINIARGSVVDESALVAALSKGAIAGAGLDVFAHEPQVPGALLSMNNVVLTPHIGSATVGTRNAMADLVFDNMVEYFTSGKPLTPV